MLMYNIWRCSANFSRHFFQGHKPQKIVSLLPTLLPIYDQHRTTYILRRKHKPPIPSRDKPIESVELEDTYYHYEEIQSTRNMKPEPLRVLLLEPVEKIGVAGEVVEVKPQYARDHLLLPGIAVYPTPENLEKYEYLKSVEQYSSKYALATINRMGRNVYSIIMNMETPWVIEPWHLHVTLRRAGTMVPLDSIRINSKIPIKGPDLSLENKEFLAYCTVNKKEEFPLRCRVHHYSTNEKDRIPYLKDYFCYPSTPIFPEEAEILAELTKKCPKVNTEELQNYDYGNT